MPGGFFAEPDQPREAGWPGSVLIVDDHIALRKVLRQFMQGMGFHVMEASNTYDALFLCAQFGRTVRMLVSEVNLLPVSGIKLAENALRLWPHIQILCTAERFNEEFTKYWLRYLGAEFLQKPFSLIEVHERMVRLFGAEMEDIPFPDMDDSPISNQGLRTSRPGANPLFWLSDREYA